MTGARVGIALAMGLLVGAANLTKAVHIDDALYLAIAEQITEAPFDPYGGVLNWQQIPEPTYKVSISPPLFNYYLAAVLLIRNMLTGLGGACGADVALHAAMTPWILLAFWSAYRLAERWTQFPLSITLLVCLGPAFVVGINLMLDVPLAACCWCSLECLMRGLERRHSLRWFVVCGVCAAAAVLIKYAAIALVVVFAAVAIQTRTARILIVAAFPLASFVGWQRISKLLYGQTQVTEGLGFLSQFRVEALQLVWERSLTLAALWAMTCPIWLLTFRCRSRRCMWSGIFAATVIVAAMLFLEPRRYGWQTYTVFLIASFLGCFGLLHALFPRRSNATSRGAEFNPHLLLVLSVLGFAGVSILFAPFVAVRSLLPATLPITLLLTTGNNDHESMKRWLRSAMCLAVALGSLLFWSDYRWAKGYQNIAREVVTQHRTGNQPVYFLGHWGWQHYAECAGFRPWDARWLDASVGSIVLIPKEADKQFLQPFVFKRLVELRRITVPPDPLRLTTWNRARGIRFYGGDYGEIPWGVSSDPTEEIIVYRVDG